MNQLAEIIKCNIYLVSILTEILAYLISRNKQWAYDKILNLDYKKFKTELISELYKTDVLNREKMIALTTLYNQKMTELQTDFLQKVAGNFSKIKVEFTIPNPKEFSDFGDIIITTIRTGMIVHSGLKFITWGVSQTSP